MTKFEKCLADAEQGDADSQCTLGEYYYQHQNFTEAKYWWELAAAQNCPQSTYNLSLLYYQGLGVTQDFERTLAYLESAKNLGDVSAIFMLGVHYLKGGMVPKDIEKSYQYLNETVAIVPDHIGAHYNLAVMKINEIKSEENLKEAIEHLLYVSMMESEFKQSAQLLLGEIYLGRQKYDHALMTLEALSRLVSEDNQLHETQLGILYSYLGCIYKHGLGIKMDLNKAKLYFTQSAKCNNVQSQCEIAYLLIQGKNDNDLPEIRHWLTLACDNGDDKACTVLKQVDALQKKLLEEYSFDGVLPS